MDVIADIQIVRTGEDTAALKAGDTVIVRTIISHPMERGASPANEGKDAQASPGIAPKRLSTITAAFEGTEVFRARMHENMSANPYLTFTFRPPKSGTLTVTWTAADGKSWSATQGIKLA